MTRYMTDTAVPSQTSIVPALNTHAPVGVEGEGLGLPPVHLGQEEALLLEERVVGEERHLLGVWAVWGGGVCVCV